ncbi:MULTISPECIES: hypothetical protein [Luteimonas]|uniref:hypothetical protein n=1 Tax=Luteimonas TaxID=83614 RepID=UPI000C7B9A0D|nr:MULTISPECIES: hypothetical protein [Luteimonas]
MLQSPARARRRIPLLFPFAAVLVASLAGCVSGAERQYANLQEDAGTCASFGSDRGSRAYTDCMLTQQRRRDDRDRESLEKTRLTSEIARDAQIMSDRARKQRCDRDPDRRECGTGDR